MGGVTFDSPDVAPQRFSNENSALVGLGLPGPNLKSPLSKMAIVHSKIAITRRGVEDLLRQSTKLTQCLHNFLRLYSGLELMGFI